MNGNTLAITAPAVLKRQDAALTVNAIPPACTDPTAKCTLSGVVGFAETSAVTDPGFPRVVVWTIGASAVTAAAPTVISKLVDTPVALAVDANNDLVVANNPASSGLGRSRP